ncbi:hypothetical protein [Thioalkalivibrio thiocyanoxidans]|uniref:hypothetical protein n=1 Tax=Thioalkalivibrio thiocyanoxidans TaxID=152475 RepID=UPI00035E03A5|nr:hypothetical protein [Thioalkalivibrio thiocyanoxidans]
MRAFKLKRTALAAAFALATIAWNTLEANSDIHGYEHDRTQYPMEPLRDDIAVLTPIPARDGTRCITDHANRSLDEGGHAPPGGWDGKVRAQHGP